MGGSALVKFEVTGTFVLDKDQDVSTWHSLKFYEELFQLVLSEEKWLELPFLFFGIAGDYAGALYSAAVKADAKENVANDLKLLGDLLASSSTIADYMTDPFIDSNAKLESLSEVAAAAGMAQTSLNLFGVLAENYRLGLIGEVSEIFGRLMSAERGEIPASVTTAVELDEAQREQIVAALSKFVKPEESIVLTEKVDSSILGGMLVHIGDKYTNMKFIDMSTATKVKTYMDLIKQPAA